jgi:hypothetical protein
MSYVLYTVRSAPVLLQNCARHRELALASEGPLASRHLIHNPLVEVLDGGFEFSVWVHSSETGPFVSGVCTSELANCSSERRFRVNSTPREV